VTQAEAGSQRLPACTNKPYLLLRIAAGQTLCKALEAAGDFQSKLWKAEQQEYAQFCHRIDGHASGIAGKCSGTASSEQIEGRQLRVWENQEAKRLANYEVFVKAAEQLWQTRKRKAAIKRTLDTWRQEAFQSQKDSVLEQHTRSLSLKTRLQEECC